MEEVSEVMNWIDDADSKMLNGQYTLRNVPVWYFCTDTLDEAGENKRIMLVHLDHSVLHTLIKAQMLSGDGYLTKVGTKHNVLTLDIV